MVRIEVRVFATLRRYLREDDQQEVRQLELPADSTVADLVARLAIPAHEVKVVFINHRAVPPERVLADGDRVGIFPLVAGG